MSYTSTEPTVDAARGTAKDIACDLLVIPVFRDEPVDNLDGLDAASGGEVNRAQSTNEFRGKADELFVARLESPDWKPARVALVGVRSAWPDTAR